MTQKTIALLIAITAAGALALVPGNAEAQRRRSRNHIDGVRADIHLDAGYYGGAGAGFRIDIPIVPNGVLRNVDDEMSISPGADFFFLRYWDRYGHDLAVLPQVLWQWSFYLSDKWSIFPEAGLGLWLGNHGHHHHRHDRYEQNHNDFWIDPIVGFGARYHFGSRVALQMRASWPVGLQIGITF